MKMRLICALLVGWVVAISSGRASAEDSPAKAHFLAGQAYYEQASYTDALREFLESYKLSKRAELLYNIAGCHEHLDHFDEAAGALEQYLVELPTASDRQTIELRVANLRARAKRTLKPAEPATTAVVPVKISSVPAAAVAAVRPATPSQSRRRAMTQAAIALGVIGGAMVLTGIATGSVALVNNDHDLAIGTDVLLFPGGAAVLTSIILAATRPSVARVTASAGGIGVSF